MNFKIITAFGIGGILGAVASYYVNKKRFEAIAEEEAEDYRRSLQELREVNSKSDNNEENVPLYETIVEDPATNVIKNMYNPYVNNTIVTDEDDESEDDCEPGPDRFISYIRPEEYGTVHDYATVTLFFNKNRGTITDLQGEVFDKEEYDSLIGEFEDHIGDYSDNCVHVRNHREMTDVEIVVE